VSINHILKTSSFRSLWVWSCTYI